MKPEPQDYSQTDRQRILDFTYLYVVRNLDGGSVLQVTNLDQDITITGTLPSFWSNGIFLSSTANHAGLKLDSESKTNGASFSLIATHPIFQRYFSVPATTRMSLDIYRCNNIDAPVMAEDVVHMFYGEMSGYGFAGFAFTASFASVSASFDKQIPNFFYQKNCNNDLYGVGCTVNRDSFKATGTITGFNRYARQLVCTISGNPSSSLFALGYLIEPITKSSISIVQAQDGAGIVRNFYTQIWIPELETIGETFTIYQGCNKTTAACKHFGNLPNFRGFPTIPTRNPVIGGTV